MFLCQTACVCFGPLIFVAVPRTKQDAKRLLRLASQVQDAGAREACTAADSGRVKETLELLSQEAERRVRTIAASYNVSALLEASGRAAKVFWQEVRATQECALDNEQDAERRKALLQIGMRALSELREQYADSDEAHSHMQRGKAFAAEALSNWLRHVATKVDQLEQTKVC